MLDIKQEGGTLCFCVFVSLLAHLYLTIEKKWKVKKTTSYAPFFQHLQFQTHNLPIQGPNKRYMGKGGGFTDQKQPIISFICQCVISIR